MLNQSAYFLRKSDVNIIYFNKIIPHCPRKENLRIIFLKYKRLYKKSVKQHATLMNSTGGFMSESTRGEEDIFAGLEGVSLGLPMNIKELSEFLEGQCFAGYAQVTGGTVCKFQMI
ncbi:hypothetical protein [Citrobacter portucalensis]|uniref:hypothetical protein n=1 Tax=Citrobacter portucalensis TaxID=1639133 RepID=UPI00226B6C33|nr:hypothetical protein [Citrobacter portucalensis]MCX8984812.1 hypothetical protein [Citrobacter portucalensis]